MLWPFSIVALALEGVAAIGNLQSPLLPQSHDQEYQFDALLHLPGISPYFDAVGFGLEHKAPIGCKVTAASYLIRHGAIYANDAEYEDIIQPFLEKLEKHQGAFSGPLKFLNEWKSPIDEDLLENLTPSGAIDARKVGKHLMDRYPDLVPTAKSILADKKSRTFDTATNLTQAFPDPASIEVVRIRKNINGSLDVINPHKSCAAFSKAPGQKEMETFLSHYAPAVAARLAPYLPDALELTNKDVLGMQSLCGYASGIIGVRSDFCDIFTDAEWFSYEYAWDLKYAHMVGPLNKLSPYLGFPWLQSQSELFSSFDVEGEKEENGDNGWPPSQRFFLSFTHREVPPFIATALGIFNSSASSEHDAFPTKHINWARAWRMADLIPFLGHVGMEKMSCDSRPGKEGDYIRFIANSAPRPLPDCQNGPGASCPFQRWKNIVRQGAEKYSDLHSVCDGEKEPTW